MIKKRFITVLFFLVLINTSKTFAWGSKGHAYVAEVAWHYLDNETKRNVLYYLDEMSIEQAANWMDAIKSDHANDYMKPYHYIDIEKGSKEMPAGDNIITVLNKTLKELDNKDKLDREGIRRRILFLFHLIGDLHQPLHIGYPGDKGGNDIKLNFVGTDSNLHSVWDSGIIEHTNMQLAEILKSDTYTPEQREAIKKIDLIAWAAQTRAYLKNAYTINDTKINEFYVNDNAKIIKSQLLNAGIRLAAVLQHYFEKVEDLSPTQTALKRVAITIEVNKAASYEGQLVTVCSKVYSTKYLDSSKSKPTFLNVGADYPNAPLTIFIEESNRANFSNKPEEYYRDKNICVTGTIRMYKGKPEIIVSKESEIGIQ
ncbi:S1/P1 nuclease [Flavobacterium sp. XGLA_31]|uniref:S1/P1 nuclease n=1 Tax=Flavobacterium sp. XGLA_31 TaxID=3447666 RepID=UPI003F2A3010